MSGFPEAQANLFRHANARSALMSVYIYMVAAAHNNSDSDSCTESIVSKNNQKQYTVFDIEKALL